MTNLNKSLLALCMVLGMAGSAAAQTCASPLAYDTPTSGPTASGDTCTQGSAVLGDICGAFFENPSPDVLFRFNINPAGPNGFTATNIALTTSSGGFNPILAVMGPGGNCDANAACPRTGSLNGAGAGETVSVAGLAAGSYFLLVSGDGTTTNCGQYTITANGTLPVQLKNFSID